MLRLSVASLGREVLDLASRWVRYGLVLQVLSGGLADAFSLPAIVERFAVKRSRWACKGCLGW